MASVRTAIALALVTLLATCAKPKSTRPEGGGSTDAGTDAECTALTEANALRLVDLEHPFVKRALAYVQAEVSSDIVPDPMFETYRVTNDSERVEFSFRFRDSAICDLYAEVVRAGKDYTVMGRLPHQVDEQKLAALSWDKQDADVAALQSKLHLENVDVTDINANPCLMIDSDDLYAAWKVDFHAHNLPYSGIVYKDTVFLAEPRFFTLTGSIESTVYRKEPVASSNIVLRSGTLDDISAGGSLCSARFVTEVPDFTKKAFSSDLTFDYEITDPRFNETSVFTYATEHSDWFVSLTASGGKWKGPQILLKLNGTDDYNNNTAVYLPPSSTQPPTIKLGLGDNKDLRNLHFDEDVVSHEIGHHYVYQTLKSTAGEALVLHEGIADFFVFARTGNPCLGELICPKSSELCISTQCLRSADNTLVLNGTGFPTEAHKKAQFISGMLWDLGKDIGLQKVGEILFKSIDFLSKEAGYTVFITALMQADKTLYSGVNACKIQEQAEKRGLKQNLKDAGVDCKSYQQ